MGKINSFNVIGVKYFNYIEVAICSSQKKKKKLAVIRMWRRYLDSFCTLVAAKGNVEVGKPSQ